MAQLASVLTSVRCIFCVLLVLCAGCAATEPVWRVRAQQSLEQLAGTTAPKLYPDAYRSMLETFEHGEAVYRVQQQNKEADLLYQLVLQKGEVLKINLAEYRAQQMEEARQKAKAEQQQRLEAERNRFLEKIAAEEAQRREQQEARRRKAFQAEQSAGTAASSFKPATYTVKRGETLPQIAARAEIYNEASLWPLIYRANRDQVRDPYQLWPGQVLKIPRAYSREEAVEARRQAGRH